MLITDPAPGRSSSKDDATHFHRDTFCADNVVSCCPMTVSVTRRWTARGVLMPTRRRLSTVLLGACLATFLIFYVLRRERALPVEYVHYKTLLAKSASNSGQCHVPRLDPWDPSVVKYYSKPSPLTCKSLQDEIVVRDPDGTLRILPDYLDSQKCRWRSFAHNEGVDDTTLVYGEWQALVNASKPSAEFVEVECTSGPLKIASFRYQFATVIPVTENLAKKKVESEDPSTTPSVIMIGLDSMSRGNMLRQLPATHAELQRQGFVDLQSHVKVLDNTYGNWLAILTGKQGTGTREFPTELPDEWNIWFDDWDLVWRHFADSGYATLFAEDRPDIGTFNYFGYLNGFRRSPVDHYFRPFWLSCFWSLAMRRSSYGCYGASALHAIQLDYLQRFLDSYEGKRKFAWWWSQDLSHDHLNQIGVIDADLKKFMSRNERHFDNAIVIVFSDHGHRYADIRETVVGRLEARLPFLSIRLPPALKEKHPKLFSNLQINALRMTTQYDLHKTLLDVSQGSFDSPKSPSSSARSVSLLGQVPLQRTCHEARVPEDYCPCYDEVQIDPKEASQAADVFMRHLNSLISGVTEITPGYHCAELVLQSIDYAAIRLPPDAVVRDPQAGHDVARSGVELQYRITARCGPPSDAVIEGLIVKNVDTGTWAATGEVERNNRYGNTSHCVANRTLKKICHCLP